MRSLNTAQNVRFCMQRLAQIDPEQQLEKSLQTSHSLYRYTL